MKKKTNAFTLIELLAVIVILAIIALIATPIILGIVEDAKKDAFLRSVELLVSTTDIDISNKTFEENYIYEITDGNISDLEVSVKNTGGMNGSIIYDVEGKEEYAIHNGTYCVIKTMDMNKAEITEYKEGECTIPDNGVLATLTQFVPNENDVVVSGSGQLINLGEYGIRYQGTNPNNYVEFNNETWRIIGIVDGKVKLIKSTVLTDEMQWDDDNNDWSTATLQTYLNNTYYNSLVSKDMIDMSTWYLIGYKTPIIDKYKMYGIERGIGSIEGTVLHGVTSIERNIGLMYPSDYGFAAQVKGSCTDTTELYRDYEECKVTNWLAGGFDEFTITASSNYGTVISAFSDGCVSDADSSPRMPSNVRPTLYLKAEVEFTGNGDGSVNNKYQLTMK